MKILVTGSRDWTDRETIYNELIKCAYTNLPHTLIHGACKGADTIAGDVAKSLGWKVIPFPAHWEILGNAAGPSRNQYMVDTGPNLVLAFHDDLEGESTGAKDCVRRARVAGIPVKVIKSGG